MIPRTIHFIWLSKDPKPLLIKICISTWKKHLKGYEIKEWSMDDFEFDKFPEFVREAIQVKKYAFACDYLRMWVLYQYGGIYLDSDVYLRKSIDEIRDNRFVSCIEFHEGGFYPYRERIDSEGHAMTELHVPGFGIQAAFLGAEKNHPYLKHCLEWYNNRHFIEEDGTLDTDMLAPDVYANCARDFGFLYKNSDQVCGEGIRILPSTFVAGSMDEFDESNYAIHCCAGSWRKKPSVKGKIYITFRSILWILRMRMGLL